MTLSTKFRHMIVRHLIKRGQDTVLRAGSTLGQCPTTILHMSNSCFTLVKRNHDTPKIDLFVKLLLKPVGSPTRLYREICPPSSGLDPDVCALSIRDDGIWHGLCLITMRHPHHKFGASYPSNPVQAWAVKRCIS